MIDNDDEEPLREVVFDLIANGRNSIRVVATKPNDNGGTRYYASFLIDVDDATHKRLGAVAAEQQRKVEKVLQRYAQLAFRLCLSSEDEEPVAQKFATD